MRGFVVRLVMGVAVEGLEDEPPGIERGEAGGAKRHQEGIEGRRVLARISGFDDGVLGKIAGEHRETGERQRADDHHPIGERDLGAQTAHHADVLLMMHGDDHRAGAEEQQRLEEGVGKEVVHADRIGADAHGDEHVAELRTGRIGDDALDVVLHECDRGGEHRRGGADHGDEGQRIGRQLEQRRQPRHHEHARRHHGGSVDQGRHRSRTFHGVRQPSVQQELRRLAHRAHEQQQADQGEGIDVPVEHVNGLADQRWRLVEDGAVIHRPGHCKHGKNAERKTEIADPIDDEGLDGGGIRFRLVIPESDQQIARQADPFPAEKQLHEVIGGHQHQHREGEHRQIAEEARPVRVLLHVTDGIEVHEGRHRGDHDEHDRRQGVDPQRPVNLEVAGNDERQHDFVRFLVGKSDPHERDPRQYHGDE